MKKILEGFFYRLIKSIEFLGLIILLVCSCVYLNASLLNETRGPIYIEENGIGRDVSGDELKNYMFQNSGVSAYDAYRLDSEPIPQDAYDKICSNSFVKNEVFLMLKGVISLNMIPSILMVLFIPIFFGRMFGDGTLKNLIACGHGKGKIYLASLLFSFAMATVMFLFNFIVFLIMILIYGWKPPVYLPVLLMMTVISFLLMFTLSAVSLAVLFASMKKTASFVAGFVLALMLFFPLTLLAVDQIDMSYELTDNYRQDMEEYSKIAREKGANAFYYKLDLNKLYMGIYYEDKELLPAGESKISPLARYALMAFIYLDPTLANHVVRNNIFQPYIAYRDGLMTLNIAVNVFWILISTASGMIIFKKREIHC